MSAGTGSSFATDAGLKRRVLVRVYGLFGRLPQWIRRRVLRAVSPKYTVGALCFVRRDDGAVLLVRHSYGARWGTVGGLTKRAEHPQSAAVREAREEAGIDVVLVGEPAFVVVPRRGRVDVVYLGRPAPGVDFAQVRPTSAEIVETRWFDPGDLPLLSPEAVSAWAALSRRGDLPPSGAPVAPGGS